MTFAHPQLLWLLTLLVPCVLLHLLGQRRDQQRLQRWLPGRTPVANRRSLWLKAAVRVLAALAIILALAQPRWDYEWRDVKRNGADVVIALDVSRSMSAADIDPNRLERAKREIKDLLAVSRGDRMALVLYSGIAFIQCPLTQDLAAFALFLDQASIDSLPVQGTSLSAALTTAAKALSEGTEQGSQGRSVILISDGEDHEGAAVDAARKLQDQGITVHAIGVGGQGAPIPLAEGGFMKDAAGNVVVTKLDESILASIAKAGEGIYVRSHSGDFDLERIYRERIRPDLQEREHSTREKLYIERHAWFTAIALLLLGLDTCWLTRSAWVRRRRPTAAGLQAFDQI